MSVLWWTLRKLTSPDPKVRMEAIGTLAEEKSPGAVEALIAALKKDQWEVRVAAAEALGSVGGVEAAQALLAALDEYIDPVCVAAARALRTLAYPWTVPSLILQLGRKAPKIRDILSDAIVASGWTAVRHVLQSFQAPGGRSVILLLLLGRFDDPLANQAILDAMKDPNPAIAKHATQIAQARGLVPKPPPSKHPPILELLNHGMREWARRVLREMGAAGIDALFNALDSPNPSLVSAVLRELMDHADGAVYERLLRHPIPRARLAAATHWIHDPRWPVSLAGALADSSGRVRRAAERCLRNHFTDAEPALLSALRNGTPAERSAAVRALYLLAQERLEESWSGAGRLRELRRSVKRDQEDRLAAQQLASARAALLLSIEQVRSRRIDWLVERVLSPDSTLPSDLDHEDAQRLVLQRVASASPARRGEAARRLALQGGRLALAWVVQDLCGARADQEAALDVLVKLKWPPASAQERVDFALASGREPYDDGARGQDQPKPNEPIEWCVHFQGDPDLPPGNIVYGDFRRASMSGFRLQEYFFNRCDFTEADLSGSQIAACVFFKCLMARSSLRGVRLESVRFIECIAPAADLSDTDSRGTEWVDGTWSHGKFCGADLRKAAFRGVDLQDAFFDRAGLEGTQFTDCGGGP